MFKKTLLISKLFLLINFNIFASEVGENKFTQLVTKLVSSINKESEWDIIYAYRCLKILKQQVILCLEIIDLHEEGYVDITHEEKIKDLNLRLEEYYLNLYGNLDIKDFLKYYNSVLKNIIGELWCSQLMYYSNGVLIIDEAPGNMSAKDYLLYKSKFLDENLAKFITK